MILPVRKNISLHGPSNILSLGRLDLWKTALNHSQSYILVRRISKRTDKRPVIDPKYRNEVDRLRKCKEYVLLGCPTFTRILTCEGRQPGGQGTRNFVSPSDTQKKRKKIEKKVPIKDRIYSGNKILPNKYRTPPCHPSYTRGSSDRL